MAVHVIGQTIAGGAGGSASSDPVVAGAQTLSAADWVDTSLLGAGTALVDTSAANGGVAFELPNGTSGSRWIGSVLTGDFLIAADVGFSSPVDINANPLAKLTFGVAPGGLTGDIDNAEWHGVRIGETSSSQVGAIPVRHVSNNTSLGSAWTGAPVAWAFKSVYERPEFRIAIERSGTDLTTWLVWPNGTRWQIDTQALVGAGDCDIFIRAVTTAAGRTAQVHRLTISGLAWVNGTLVSTA